MPSSKRACQDTATFCLGIYLNAQIRHINLSSLNYFRQKMSQKDFYKSSTKWKLDLISEIFTSLALWFFHESNQLVLWRNYEEPMHFNISATIINYKIFFPWRVEFHRIWRLIFNTLSVRNMVCLFNSIRYQEAILSHFPQALIVSARVALEGS